MGARVLTNGTWYHYEFAWRLSDFDNPVVTIRTAQDFEMCHSEPPRHSPVRRPHFVVGADAAIFAA
jgi:hypothetical protein